MKIDKISYLFTTNVLVTCDRTEMQLNRLGYTLGYYPVPSDRLTIRECLEKRIPNVFALKYGEIDDICLSLKLSAKEGGVIETKHVPRSATGPDFKKMIIGSGGSFGKITEATLKFFPMPERIIWGVSLWKSKDLAKKCSQELIRKGTLPSFVGVFAPEEAPDMLAGEKKVVLLVRWSGLRQVVRAYGRFGAVATEKMGGEDISRRAQNWIGTLEKFVRSRKAIRKGDRSRFVPALLRRRPG